MSKKLFSFASILAMVANAVGRTPADVSATGLTEDDNQLLTDNFGAEFVAKFEKERTAGTPEASSENLLTSIRAHMDTEVKAAIDGYFEKLEASKKEQEGLSAKVTSLEADKKALEAQVETLSGQSAGVPKAEFPSIPSAKEKLSVVNINANASHYQFINQAMSNPDMVMDATTDTIDIVDAKSEFKSFLSQDGNNGLLLTQIFKGFTSAGEFRVIRVKEKYHKSVKAQVNSVVQKFSKYFTPKGDFKFTPMVIETFHHKINVTFTPADIIDKYIDYLYDQSLRPDQMPITMFLSDVLIKPSVLEDLEYRMVWKGKYVENNDPKVATDPEDSMNGVEQILINAKALRNTPARTGIHFYENYIDIATATDAQVIAHARGFAQFCKKHKLKIDRILCSEAYRTRYVFAYDNMYKGNSGVAGEINKDATIDYSPSRFIEIDGMGSSPILLGTVKGNLVMTRKRNAEPNIINDIQREDYDIKIFGEFNTGVGLEFGELAYACVPDNYDPQAELSDSTEFPDGTKPATGSTPAGSAGDGLG